MLGMNLKSSSPDFRWLFLLNLKHMGSPTQASSMGSSYALRSLGARSNSSEGSHSLSQASLDGWRDRWGESDTGESQYALGGLLKEGSLKIAR